MRRPKRPSWKQIADEVYPDASAGEPEQESRDDRLAGAFSVVQQFLANMAFLTMEQARKHPDLTEMWGKYNMDPEWLPSAKEAREGLRLMGATQQGGEELRARLMALEEGDPKIDSLEEPPEGLWG